MLFYLFPKLALNLPVFVFELFWIKLPEISLLASSACANGQAFWSVDSPFVVEDSTRAFPVPFLEAAALIFSLTSSSGSYSMFLNYKLIKPIIKLTKLKF